MPTLNSDGSINTSTDGTWDWKANHTDEEVDAARYEITKAWTLASIKFNKALMKPVSHSDIKIVPGGEELVLCFNTDEHIGTLVDALPEQIPEQFMHYSDSYSSAAGEPAPELPTEISISVDLFNGTGQTIIFDKLHVDYFGGGIYGYDPSDALYNKYQPFCCRLDTMNIDFTDSMFWLTEEDEEKMHEMFGDFPTETTPYRPKHQMDFNAPLGQYIELQPRALLHVCNIVIRPTHTRKIKTGNRVRELVCRFFGLYAGFNGAYGVGEEAGGYAFATSYALDSIREIKVGLASHCEFDRQYGAWQDNGGEEIEEGWKFDEPTPPPPPPDKNRSKRNGKHSEISGRIYVSNSYGGSRHIDLSFYGNKLRYRIPGTFVGWVMFRTKIIGRAGTGTIQAKSITPIITVDTSDGVACSGLHWYVENDPDIPEDGPYTENNGSEKLVLTDNIVCFTVTGAPAPIIDDHLVFVDNTVINITRQYDEGIEEHAVLVDNTVVNIARQYDEDIEEHAVLVDNADVTITAGFTGDVEDHAVLNDDLLLNISGPIRKEINDELVLTDNVSVNISTPFQGNVSDIVELTDNAILAYNS